MLRINGKSVLEKQIKAAEAEAKDILKEEKRRDQISILRQIVQMKGRVACFLIEELGDMITRFLSNGVSSVSLVPIVEAYQQAIGASASEMQVFANKLAWLTHNKDMEEAYSHLSERFTSLADDLVIPLKESEEKALLREESMIFAEIYETWRNMSNKPINN